MALPIAIEAAMPTTQTPSGLTLEDLVLGAGEPAVAGRSVTVHYSGGRTSGSKVDSSKDRNDPIVFHLGAGQVSPWKSRHLDETDSIRRCCRTGDKSRSLAAFSNMPGSPLHPR